jgi:DNA-binding LytR/AlgR family response regulator
MARIFVVCFLRSVSHAVRSTLHPNRLVRTHRSNLVNPTAVREVEARPRGGLTLILENGSKVPVSPRYVEPVMARPTSIPGAAFSSHSHSRQSVA